MNYKIVLKSLGIGVLFTGVVAAIFGGAKLFFYLSTLSPYVAPVFLALVVFLIVVFISYDHLSRKADIDLFNEGWEKCRTIREAEDINFFEQIEAIKNNDMERYRALVKEERELLRQETEIMSKYYGTEEIE